jgi:ABC-type maltose transport system permease subunit
VPVAIALLRGRYQGPWGKILAASASASVVAAAQVAALVPLFQRWLVSGLPSRALKEPGLGLASREPWPSGGPEGVGSPT